MVIGIAASMAAAILPAFDEVYFDPDAELMFHKARVFDGFGGVIPESELDEETVGRLNRFNAKTYSRLIDAGVNADFAKDVFLSDSNDDVFITAEEAEALGLGTIKAAQVGEAFQLAAMGTDLIKDQLKIKMGIFNRKKKDVLQVVDIAEGQKIAFESDSEEIKTGLKVQAVGGYELGNEMILADNRKAVLSDEGEITDIMDMEEEEPKNAPTDEQMAEAMMRIADLEAAVEALREMVGTAEAEAEEAEAEADKEVENLKSELANTKEDLASVTNKLKTLTSPSKLEKIEDKQETQISSGMTAEQTKLVNMHGAVEAARAIKNK
jgi:hypothetical protein